MHTLDLGSKLKRANCLLILKKNIQIMSHSFLFICRRHGYILLKPEASKIRNVPRFSTTLRGPGHLIYENKLYSVGAAGR